MTHRLKHHFLFSNDENRSSTQLWLYKLFGCCSKHDYYSSITASSLFYTACQNGDIAYVESFLKKMTLDEINYQYPPNNETALHIATQKQHKEIIELLLRYGALPSLRNIEGQDAYELAEAEKIKDLFKRPESSRFTFSPCCSNITTSAESKLTCKSCSLIDNNTMYEWELVDRNVSQKAFIFRQQFKPMPSMNAKFWKKKFYSLKKAYIPTHLQDLSKQEGAIIQNYFKLALTEQDPKHLVAAYTRYQHFSKLLNINMRRNVIHDLRNGCSQFSCQCLYLTGDGTKSFANIFFHHPNFQKLDFKGVVYRGIVMPKYQLGHYIVGSSILTTTFLSTSTNPHVAEAFGDGNVSNPPTHSFFCTYKIINDGRTAIDISKLSTYPVENEVLIFPYTLFLIIKIEEVTEERTNIYLEEQCVAHI